MEEIQRPWVLLSDSELDSIPEPRWLVENYVTDGLTVLFGPPGVGKSLLALDWACSLQAGIPWAFSKTEQRNALYVSAEGTSGLPTRRDSWKTDKGAETKHLYVIPQAVDLMDSHETDALIADVQATNAGFLIVDTLARAMAGKGDENSAQDISNFVRGLDRVCEETGTAALLVHHCGYDYTKPRGSTALFAAADTVMALMPGDINGDAVLRCDKQKNGLLFNALTLRMTTVGDSAVLKPKPSAVNHVGL